jgi:hypothetical protein
MADTSSRKKSAVLTELHLFEYLVISDSEQRLFIVFTEWQQKFYGWHELKDILVNNTNGNEEVYTGVSDRLQMGKHIRLQETQNFSLISLGYRIQYDILDIPELLSLQHFGRHSKWDQPS